MQAHKCLMFVFIIIYFYIDCCVSKNGFQIAEIQAHILEKVGADIRKEVVHNKSPRYF